MTEGTFTITLKWEQLGDLSDVLYEALHSTEADDDELAAYLALRDEIKRQIGEQR